MRHLRYPWPWALLCLAIFSICGASFIVHQSIWTDETTQLGGLTLGPIQVVYWLLGEDYHLDIPFDRMPPLSYWIGQLWSSVFGLSIMSMRSKPSMNPTGFIEGLPFLDI